MNSIPCFVAMSMFLSSYSFALDTERNHESINNNDERLNTFKSIIIPSLEGKRKGESGKIGVIGGSIEYTGAPYFSAISALKAGADLLFVITTPDAAPVIKSYSPDLIVYPFLNTENLSNVISLLPKMDVVVIGAGLGREEATMKLTYEIIEACKTLKKPLVIDADGLYAVSKNLSVLITYPSPGVILTPNFREVGFLKESTGNIENWCSFWGENVSIVSKGKQDEYCDPKINSLEWTLADGGSNRRAAGQGDILAGVLGTFYNWAIRANMTKNNHFNGKSISTYAAAKLTRTCNFKAYSKYGRSMIASNMLDEIHNAFEELFS